MVFWTEGGGAEATANPQRPRIISYISSSTFRYDGKEYNLWAHVIIQSLDLGGHDLIRCCCCWWGYVLLLLLTHDNADDDPGRCKLEETAGPLNVLSPLELTFQYVLTLIHPFCTDFIIIYIINDDLSGRMDLYQ